MVFSDLNKMNHIYLHLTEYLEAYMRSVLFVVIVVSRLCSKREFWLHLIISLYFVNNTKICVNVSICTNYKKRCFTISLHLLPNETRMCE